ncbi:TPA: RNA-directed DNA polymerase, partial [Enterococcus faecium]|nr:RNA-directed DNA polymerase [Enterococcus faecium]HBK5782638.1 RNA-directed DNA polymerase [Enterococcus faecium]
MYKERDDLNYTLIINKDGNYSWRPLVLLHPILYVDLVNCLTKEDHWEELKKRFSEFKKDKNINCYSIPVEASKGSKRTDLGETILNWWEYFEQKSLAQNIKYQYCMFTDIADCYPSIYTHSITWAMYGKEKVKNDENKCSGSLGDKIDKKISGMQHNQTNGIPQGSVLMDFVAEIVLGYVDLRLSKELKKLENLKDYKVLRYRDDYRIFSNNRNDLEQIMKVLSEVLYDLNFKLNSSKTKLSDDIIIDSIKKDKLYWEEIKASIRMNATNLDGDREIRYSINLQKHLLEIKKLADKHPNSGQLKKALSEFNKERIIKITSKPNDLLPLIGILVDIMINNPGSLPQCVLIIGQLLNFENESKAREIV